ncbi:hypothetical protein AOG23_30610 [Rhizobium acidisoli]|nr:hypothetical protein AOG23_30610 [Rhizobium acidisoli]
MRVPVVFGLFDGKRIAWLSSKLWLPFASTVRTAEIYLPDVNALPNRCRDALVTAEERKPISIDGYASRVHEVVPELVKDAHRPIPGGTATCVTISKRLTDGWLLSS